MWVWGLGHFKSKILTTAFLRYLGDEGCICLFSKGFCNGGYLPIHCSIASISSHSKTLKTRFLCIMIFIVPVRCLRQKFGKDKITVRIREKVRSWLIQNGTDMYIS